ncbi:MAG: GAF domain-containing protein [Chitinophagaceae bacterium]
MNLLTYTETPFLVKFCFDPMITRLEKVVADQNGARSGRSRELLEALNNIPALRTGISDPAEITDNETLINELLAPLFPEALGMNEIKAVNIPYTNIIFNHTQRFRNILNAAGPSFEINIRDFDEKQFYIMSCCIILNAYYGTHLDFGKPLFYDIPTADGVIRHYRILYNAEFLDIQPTEKAVQLTDADIELLLNSYDDIDLWKEKFPQESWVVKGFAIMNLFDATVENAVSIFKEKLLALNTINFQASVESIFRSIYRIPDIRVGFTVFNKEDAVFSMDAFGRQMQSFILNARERAAAREVLCTPSFYCLVDRRHFFAISDTDIALAHYPESVLINGFSAQGIRSFILAPVVKNDVLLGVLEVVAPRSKELNSINANKLDVVMPFLTDTVERLIAQLENRVQAVIQEKYTAVHSSVHWRFRDEAQMLIREEMIGHDYVLNEIVFPDVYPLYGQVDIKGSSEVRNAGVQNDLILQMKALLQLLQQIEKALPVERFTDECKQLEGYLEELSVPLKAGTEQHITNYLSERIYPRISAVSAPVVSEAIAAYFAGTEKETGIYHTHRRQYEQTISLINYKMARVIDKSQAEAQQIFPHYFERFKTDGVEHNLYIGTSIAPALDFSPQHLQQLRYWQLEVLCKMETAQHKLKPALPYPLDVTTLVLVYNATISIRFRMDEKRFDVDGSYNARFEIVKKRIDKAHAKESGERITQAGKLTVVYSNEAEELEYRGYLKRLQEQGYVGEEVECFEVEDLQGVSGLRVLRVGVARKGAEAQSLEV